MKKLVLSVTVMIAAIMSSTVYAACNCLCVGNERRWVCENSWDPKPGGYCGGWCSGAVYEPEIKTPDLTMNDPLDAIRDAYRKTNEIVIAQK